jgi:hypothetical protein
VAEVPKMLTQVRLKDWVVQPTAQPLVDRELTAARGVTALPTREAAVVALE